MTRNMNQITLAGLVAIVALSSSFARAQDRGDVIVSPSPAPGAAVPAQVVAPTPQGYQPRVQLQAQPYVPAYLPGGRPRIVGYRETTQSRPALWGPGLGIFLAGYVLNFAAFTPLANAISSDRDGASEQDAWAWSLLPLAGPIVQLGIGAPHPAIPITMGLMQIGGLVMFIYGLAEQETVRVPVHVGDPDDPNIPTISFDASPLPGGGQFTVRLTHL